MPTPTLPMPDARRHHPQADYLRDLIEASRLSQAEIAQRIGVDARTFRRYLLGETRISYPVQFAVECLVAGLLAARRAAPVRAMPRRQLTRELLAAEVERQSAAPASYARQRADTRAAEIQRELRRRDS